MLYRCNECVCAVTIKTKEEVYFISFGDLGLAICARLFFKFFSFNILKCSNVRNYQNTKDDNDNGKNEDLFFATVWDCGSGDSGYDKMNIGTDND